MEINTYKVLNLTSGDDVIDYNAYEIINDKGVTCYTIKTSSNGEWSECSANEVVIRAIDNGNGIKFEKRLERELSYDDVASLYILLCFMNKEKDIYDGKIIKTEEILNI